MHGQYSPVLARGVPGSAGSPSTGGSSPSFRGGGTGSGLLPPAAARGAHRPRALPCLSPSSSSSSLSIPLTASSPSPPGAQTVPAWPLPAELGERPWPSPREHPGVPPAARAPGGLRATGIPSQEVWVPLAFPVLASPAELRAPAHRGPTPLGTGAPPPWAPEPPEERARARRRADSRAAPHCSRGPGLTLRSILRFLEPGGAVLVT